MGKCPMLSSGRSVRHTCMQSIRCYKCWEERDVWWFTAESLPSKQRRGKSMWVIHGFKFCHSFSELEFLVCWLSFDLRCCREMCLLYRFSLLIGSIWIFFVFYYEGHRLAEKLLLLIFIFWQILSTFRYVLILCAETPFSILKKVSAPITSGECSRGL